tara:strand:- start:1673 stop:1849 length:177 start_codon:yes stop_codon:yes gene_type:complete
MENSKTQFNGQIGTELYFTDTNEYFGIVVKVLTQTVWVEKQNGDIEKRWNIHFANEMI